MKNGLIAAAVVWLAANCATIGAQTSQTLEQYALSRSLSADETYTVECLIDRVQWRFDETYWDTYAERDKARESPDYEPKFDKQHLKPAQEALEKTSWLSLQRLGDSERPIRDLGALRCLPQLKDLTLNNNEVSDLTPLADCKALVTLDLYQNPVKDLTPLTKCPQLEELELGLTQVTDLTPLESMPKLRRLVLNAEQIPAFTRLKRLPALQSLVFGLEGFDSFAGFPEMPDLRCIEQAEVKKLDGLERFPKLENLVNLSGRFTSLEPLRNLKQLTHINVLRSGVTTLKPLEALTNLRYVSIETSARRFDVSPLEALPNLHEVSVQCRWRPAEGLKELQATLKPWDVEFLADKPRYRPSLTVEVVDEETFEHFNGEAPYNRPPGTNEQMLSSELDWLDEKLEAMLTEKYGEDDFVIPFDWPGARSRTVVLVSKQTMSAFPEVVKGSSRFWHRPKRTG